MLAVLLCAQVSRKKCSDRLQTTRFRQINNATDVRELAGFGCPSTKDSESPCIGSELSLQ